jgi:4-diphosphocytidyl-2-C-methyl-D-erythritol kinase
MISFPNAKINLGLHVTGKRQDGYHNIETVFYPLGLSDILEVTPSSDARGHYTFLNTGTIIEGEPSDNLCIRAWNELNKIRPLPGVSIHLHKIIPSGAGLGGGSSNAVYVLRALNDLFQLGLQASELELIAGGIGSDCPFFMHNKPLFATGRGEIFEPAEIDLKGLRIVIVHAGIHIDTARAYREIALSEHAASLKDLIYTDPYRWQGKVVNDFEQVVFSGYPEIRYLKEQLLASGAFYSSMTGSGSAVYGLFDYEADIKTIKRKFPGLFLWDGLL